MYSRTPNLRKRVEALEKALPPPPTPCALSGEHSNAIDGEIMRLADAMVSEEDRQICERMLEEDQPGRESTERECAAIDKYLSAIAVECKRAGYSSIDEFQESYCGAA